MTKRKIGFVLRRFPDHSLLKFCDQVKPSLVVGDENPMREPESWRRTVTKKLKRPLWTVDADVIVPSKLLEKQQYAAHIIRPRLQAQLGSVSWSRRKIQKRRWRGRQPQRLQSLDPDV